MLRFRITAWPLSPLPLPRVSRLPCRLADGLPVVVPDLVALLEGHDPADLFRLNSITEPVRLSGETYLELLRLDPAHPAAAASFTRRYGVLGGIWAREFLRNARLPGLPSTAGYAGLADQEQDLALKQQAVRQEFGRLPSARLRQLLSDSDQPLHDLCQAAETLAEFRFAAGLLRDLAQAWLVLRERRDPSSVTWDLAAHQDVARQPPWGAATLLTHVLPALLSSFGPRLQAEMTGPFLPGEAGLAQLFELPADTPEVREQAGPPAVHLFEACALELFNHIAEDATYRTCASETCDRIFVRQQGRARYGQNRTAGELLYCSASCARAQAQRRYRRRHRSKTVTEPGIRDVDAAQPAE